MERDQPGSGTSFHGRISRAHGCIYILTFILMLVDITTKMVIITTKVVAITTKVVIITTNVVVITTICGNDHQK